MARKPGKFSLPVFESDALMVNAIRQLAADERFGQFMELIRQKRDEAMMMLILDDTVKDDRLTLSAIGTIRAMQEILDQYSSVTESIPTSDTETHSQ